MIHLDVSFYRPFRSLFLARLPTISIQTWFQQCIKVAVEVVPRYFHLWILSTPEAGLVSRYHKNETAGECFQTGTQFLNLGASTVAHILRAGGLMSVIENEIIICFFPED